MKEKVGMIAEPKAGFKVLFNILWKAEPKEKTLEEINKDLNVSKETMKELEKSLKDIDKFESDLFKESIKKKPSKENKFKSETQAKVPEAKEAINENKMHNEEKERE